MKKYLLLISVFVLILLTTFFMNNYKVGSFNLSEYEEYITKFKYIEKYNSVNNSKELIILAKQIWYQKFKYKEKILSKYIIKYDSDNDIWLISIKLSNNTLGGTPYLLVKGNGETVAVWHDK